MYADLAFMKLNTVMRNEKTDEEALTQNIIWYSSSLFQIEIQNKHELTYNVRLSQSLAEVLFNAC